MISSTNELSVLTSIYTLHSGLPHTQGIQGISGNFQVEENLRESQGNSGNFDLFFKLRETQANFNFF